MDLNLRIERAFWDLFWIPPDVEVIDRPELLCMRCARSDPYLNSVQRCLAVDGELEAVIEEVTHFHRAQGSRWMLPDHRRHSNSERLLAQAGYQRGAQHHTMVIQTQEHQRRPSAGIRVKQVKGIEDLSAAVAVSDFAFGKERQRSPDELAEMLKSCSGEGARARRFFAYDVDHGEPLSSGGMSLYPELNFALLWAGGTRPSARGRGAYSAILAARIQEAARMGIGAVGLYARRDTSAPIVARQGFQKVGGMVYWDRLQTEPNPA